MSFAIYAPENKDHKPNDQLTTTQNKIQQLSELLDEDYDTRNRNEHLRECHELADIIKADLQKYFKNGDNQGLKLMKFHNQQLRRLQNQENVQIVDEDTSLLQEQEQDVDIQIFEENVQQRKQRLQNVHRNLSSVKSVFEKISEVAEKQVEQMFSVESNYNYAEEKTGKAAQELLKAQQAQKSKIGYKIIVIIVLILIICVTVLLI